MPDLKGTIETSVRDSQSAGSDRVIAAAVEGLGLRCYAKLTKATQTPTLFVTIETIDRFGNRARPALAELTFKQDPERGWQQPNADAADQAAAP